ncbi:hypothetical protein ACF044_03775 [Microbacterium sp. NPDC016588]
MGRVLSQPTVDPRRQVIAATLLLGSAALQYVAAAERWLVAPATWTRQDRWIEDHLFDYSYPADPWENIGTAAQWFGAGYLLLAAGVLVLAGRGHGPAYGLSRIAAVSTAACLGLTGVHAFASGVLGVPTFLQWPILLLGVIAFAGLIVLVAVSIWSAPATALTSALLLMTTVPGYIFACFVIAPAVVGSSSYDTTPHTETVIAVATAAAAAVLLIASSISALRRMIARRPTGGTRLAEV